MSEVPIPTASLTRLRQSYQQFLDLAGVISDAMGIPPEAQRRLELERGVFVLEGEVALPSSNGLAEAHA